LADASKRRSTTNRILEHHVIHGSLKRRFVAGVAAAVAVTGVALASAPTASAASTMPKGHIKICARGNFSVQLNIEKDQAGNGPAVVTSPVLAPGNCWERAFNGGNNFRRINIGGRSSSGTWYYAGFYLWNSSNSGLGISGVGTLTGVDPLGMPQGTARLVSW
jgi:hypothetical protein